MTRKYTYYKIIQVWMGNKAGGWKDVGRFECKSDYTLTQDRESDLQQLLKVEKDLQGKPVRTVNRKITN